MQFPRWREVLIYLGKEIKVLLNCSNQEIGSIFRNLYINDLADTVVELRVLLVIYPDVQFSLFTSTYEVEYILVSVDCIDGCNMITRRVNFPYILYLFAERVNDKYFFILCGQVDKVFSLNFF